MKFHFTMLKVFFLLGLINSCSPAHVLFVKNNSNEEKEIIVELKQKNSSQELLFCKELVSDEQLEHKAFVKYYKEGKCYHEKINVISKDSYKFILPVNYTVNIVPNNSIYPFEKIYYIADNKKCFINEAKSFGCEQKIGERPRLVNIVEILN